MTSHDLVSVALATKVCPFCKQNDVAADATRCQHCTGDIGMHELLNSGVIEFVSGEFFLNNRPNGGTVIVFRSLWGATGAYLVALLFKAAIAPAHQWHFDVDAARSLVAETLPWWGAMFAGLYAAFYARFSSQWTYLADVYNQLMAASLGASSPSPSPDQQRVLDTWWAGFLEDAQELHLATKPMFAGVIRSVIRRQGVRQAFIDGTAGGASRLARLEYSVEAAFEKASLEKA
jgi:hypothetical protein